MVNLHLTQNLHIYSWSTTWHLQSTISNGGQLLSRRCWGMVRMDGSWPKFQCDRPLTTACWADGARMTQDNSSSVRVQRVGTSQFKLVKKTLDISILQVLMSFFYSFPPSPHHQTPEQEREGKTHILGKINVQITVTDEGHQYIIK